MQMHCQGQQLLSHFSLESKYEVQPITFRLIFKIYFVTFFLELLETSLTSFTILKLTHKSRQPIVNSHTIQSKYWLTQKRRSEKGCGVASCDVDREAMLSSYEHLSKHELMWTYCNSSSCSYERIHCLRKHLDYRAR